MSRSLSGLARDCSNISYCPGNSLAEDYAKSRQYTGPISNNSWQDKNFIYVKNEFGQVGAYHNVNGQMGAPSHSYLSN